LTFAVVLNGVLPRDATAGPLRIAGVLLFLAEKVDLKKFLKNQRGPEKLMPERIFDPKIPHVSTARILAG